MVTDTQYTVRDFKEEDRRFIVPTFLNGLYYGDSWFSCIPKDVFMDNYKKVVNALIDSPRAVVKVACFSDSPDVILGFSILSADYSTVHWVHVKEMYRKQGISRRLVPQYPTAVTHLNTLGKALMSKVSTAVFNPFLI